MISVTRTLLTFILKYLVPLTSDCAHLQGASYARKSQGLIKPTSVVNS